MIKKNLLSRATHTITESVTKKFIYQYLASFLSLIKTYLAITLKKINDNTIINKSKLYSFYASNQKNNLILSFFDQTWIISKLTISISR